MEHIENGIIFTDKDYDLRDEYIKPVCDIFQSNYIRTNITSIRVCKIGSRLCGVKFRGQRPNRIMIEEPEFKSQTQLKRYIDWLSKEVAFCGSNDCKFIYSTNDTTTVFRGRKEFSEWLEAVRQC